MTHLDDIGHRGLTATPAAPQPPAQPWPGMSHLFGPPDEFTPRYLLEKRWRPGKTAP